MRGQNAKEHVQFANISVNMKNKALMMQNSAKPQTWLFTNICQTKVIFFWSVEKVVLMGTIML